MSMQMYFQTSKKFFNLVSNDAIHAVFAVLVIPAILFLLVFPVKAESALPEATEKMIPVSLDGLPIPFDVQPVIRNERTMVPFRAIAEALNVKVDWNSELRQVSAKDDNNSILLEIDNTTAILNQNPISLDSPPVIISDRTFIPLRFFSEAFGCEVLWDKDTGGVKIFSPRKEMEIIGFYALGDATTSSWKNLFTKPFPETVTGNTDAIGELALGWFSLDAKGNLLTRSRTGWEQPEGWDKVLESAKKYSLGSEMVVHMADGDSSLSMLISDEMATKKAVAAIVREATLYKGVNLDFEGLGWQEEGERLSMTRSNISRFVKLLYEQLKNSGLNLTLTLHPLNGAYPGYDYKALGETSDRIIIMAYDYGETPEPAQRVIEAVEMARELVPPEKLVLGISIPSETAESFRTKVGIAKRYNLKGIAIWRLGLVPQDIWDVLRKSAKPVIP